jgi:nicotinate-nucleotide adenylyltransferase
MKIGLYFGSFNPIHVGHLIIANHVANNTNLNQVWLVVSPQNPFKPSNSLLNEYDRLHLVNLAIEGNALLKATDIEFKLPKPSYTIDTLTYLQEKYPSYQFSIIMGSDSFQNLDKWKNGSIILNNYELYVFNRPGHLVKPPQANVLLLDAPLLDISSTKIRELIKNKKAIQYLVVEKVEKEILNNNYYK